MTLTDDIIKARIRKKVGELKDRIDKDRQSLAMLIELLAESDRSRLTRAGLRMLRQRIDRSVKPC